MKSFIFKILAFIIIPIVLYIGIATVLKMKFRHNIESHQTIILGDSQTEFVKIPGIYNHSIPASPFFLHFEFAKEFIDQLKNKKIYIACNYHNLSKLYQNRLANDTLHPGWRRSTFRSLDELNIVNHKYSEFRPDDLKYRFIDIKKYPRLIRRHFKKKTKNSEFSIINDTLSMENAIKRHWTHPQYILNDSIQRAYLNKLILLLKENNCEVILLKMPLANYYLSHVPAEIKEELPRLSIKYNIRILDLNSALSISKDYSYFKDYGHLNKNGDSLVSRFFEKNEIGVQTQNLFQK